MFYGGGTPIPVIPEEVGIVGRGLRYVGAVNPVPPPTLYHYTTTRGFQGIIDDNCLWFSDPLHLNDGSEIRYGQEMFREVLLD